MHTGHSQEKRGQSRSMIGRSAQFQRAVETACRVAKSKANIFISGESGTGKEVFAQLIHEESLQREGPFIAINCSAIPENLLESELFGHTRGAFTGAQEKRIGLLEEAENGTLFLDEIGDLSPLLQAKLLRVLQEKKIKRVGDNQMRSINCRIISATHKNLIHEIAEETFREDLYYRLKVIPINLPPLRERPEDIMPLAEYFLKRFALENGSPARCFSNEAIASLLHNPWRGNVRELENTIERAVVLATEAEISAELIQANIDSPPDLRSIPANETRGDFFRVDCRERTPSLEELVQMYIEFAIQRNNGARDKTAKALGIDRKTLYRKLKADNLGDRAPH